MSSPDESRDVSGSLIVFSDLHLTDPNEEKARLLYDALERINPLGVEYLVFLGDTFNFCFGSSFYAKKYAFLGAACEKLAAAGVKVVFFEGNHEFGIEGLQWKGVSFVSEKELILSLLSGAVFKCSHGDLIQKDLGYRLLRFVLKSRLVYFIARHISGEALDLFASSFSRVRHIRGDRSRLNHCAIMKSVIAWASQPFSSQKSRSAHALFGHFHEPYFARLNSTGTSTGFVVGVPGWEKPNILVFREGEFFRSWLSEPGRPFTWSRPEVFPKIDL